MAALCDLVGRKFASAGLIMKSVFLLVCVLVAVASAYTGVGKTELFLSWFLLFVFVFKGRGKGKFVRFVCLGYIEDNNFAETLSLNQTFQFKTFTPPSEISSAQSNLTLFSVSSDSKENVGKLRYTYVVPVYELLIEGLLFVVLIIVADLGRVRYHEKLLSIHYVLSCSCLLVGFDRH